MKKGDKVLCKKSYSHKSSLVGQDTSIKYTKGKWYEIWYYGTHHAFYGQNPRFNVVLIFTGSRNTSLPAGNILGQFYVSPIQRKIVKEETQENLKWYLDSLLDFDKYFYTEIELRKLKIEKLSTV